MKQTMVPALKEVMAFLPNHETDKLAGYFAERHEYVLCCELRCLSLPLAAGTLVLTCIL
jgi:hypothetical protein